MLILQEVRRDWRLGAEGGSPEQGSEGPPVSGRPEARGRLRPGTITIASPQWGAEGSLRKDTCSVLAQRFKLYVCLRAGSLWRWVRRRTPSHVTPPSRAFSRGCSVTTSSDAAPQTCGVPSTRHHPAHSCLISPMKTLG